MAVQAFSNEYINKKALEVIEEWNRTGDRIETICKRVGISYSILRTRANDVINIRLREIGSINKRRAIDKQKNTMKKF